VPAPQGSHRDTEAPRAAFSGSHRATETPRAAFSRQPQSTEAPRQRAARLVTGVPTVVRSRVRELLPRGLPWRRGVGWSDYSWCCCRQWPAADLGRRQATRRGAARPSLILRCNACHEVSGEALPPPDVVPAVALGGRRLLPPSEEALRADILLPSSHFAVGYPTEQITKDGRSRMPDYSKALTETQVADLVAFLRAHYQRGLPRPRADDAVSPRPKVVSRPATPAASAPSPPAATRPRGMRRRRRSG